MIPIWPLIPLETLRPLRGGRQIEDLWRWFMVPVTGLLLLAVVTLTALHLLLDAVAVGLFTVYGWLWPIKRAKEVEDV